MYKKPSKAELIWRSMLKYYAAVISGICHKRTRVREATNGELGYTDNAGNVFVAKNHYFYDTIRNEIKAQTETGKKLVYMYGGSHKKKLSQLVEDIVNMYRLGIVVHEALHQLLSDFSYMVRFLDRKESEKELAYEYQKKVFLTVWNLVEDPAIEGIGAQYVGGVAMKALRFSIAVTDLLGGDFDQGASSAYEELHNALVQFGDMGVIHGTFRHPDAKKKFAEIAPMYYEAINEPVASKRVDRSWGIFLKMTDIWKDKTQEEMEEFLKKVEETFKKLLESDPEILNKQSTGSKANVKKQPQQTKLNQKRDITIKKVKREEYEAMKQMMNQQAAVPDDAEAVMLLPEDFNEQDARELLENAVTEENPSSGNSSLPMPGSPQQVGNQGTSQSTQTQTTQDGSTNCADGSKEAGTKQSGTSSKGTAQENTSDKGKSTTGAPDEAKAEGGTASGTPSDKEGMSEGTKAGEKSSSEGKTEGKPEKDELSESGTETGQKTSSDASSGKSSDGPARKENSETGTKEPLENASGKSSGENSEGEAQDGAKAKADASERKATESAAGAQSGSDPIGSNEARGSQMTEGTTKGEQTDSSGEGNASSIAEGSTEPEGLSADEERLLDEEEIPGFSENDFTAVLNGVKKEKDKLEEEFDEAEAYFSQIDSFASEIGSTAGFESVHAANRFVDEVEEETSDQYDRLVEEIVEYIEPFKDEIDGIFEADRVRKEFAETGSRVNLKRVALHAGARVFERRTLPGNKNDVCFCIAVDNSGSTNGEKNLQEKVACVGIAEALSMLDVPLYIFGFNVKGGTPVQTHYVRWENTRFERERLLCMKSGGCNFDSYSIRYATQLLQERSEHNKVLIVVSDGCPSSGFSGEEGILQNALAVNDAKKAGIKVLGMSVGDVVQEQFVKMYGRDGYVAVDNPEDLFDNLSERIKFAIDEG